MRVSIDHVYMDKVFKIPEDLSKAVSIPSIKAIVALCKNKSDLIQGLPKEWLSDELFNELVNILPYKSDLSRVVKRFSELGCLPKLTPEKELKLIKNIRDSIVFFPNQPYEVWLESSDGIYNSDEIPVPYRTKELLINVLSNRGHVSPDLLTDDLIDSYIEQEKTLDHIPMERITLERVKRLLTLDNTISLTKGQVEQIIVDEELADLLCGSTYNFEYVPYHLHIRARVMTVVINESKTDHPSLWNRNVAKTIKRKNWFSMKFNMEVLEKTGDKGVKGLLALYEDAKEPLDMTGLVKAYPGAIKYVGKSDQTKGMADAVLASERAAELKDYLSLKFITKSTSPLFLSSDDKDIKEKVERVLTGQPKRPIAPPPYTIPVGNEVELELIEEDISRLRQSGVPFII